MNALDLPEELSQLTVRDTLFLIRKLGEQRHEEANLNADFATLPPPPTILTPEEEADQLLAFSSFDDFIL